MKSTISLSYAHIYAHTSNICLECGGGQRSREDGKWREGRQRREREEREGGTKGKEISGRNMNGSGVGGGGDYKPGDDGLKTEDLE